MSDWKSWNRHLDSPRHPLVQAVRRLLRSSRARREQGLVVVEGPRLVEEALRAGAGVRQLFVAEQPRGPATAQAAGGPLPGERLEQLLELARERGAELIRCGPRVMAAIADTEHPQGIVAVVHLPQPEGGLAGALARRWRRGLALLVDGVQ
ncbi:MAG TPA: RNA methyltransferase substrate-binding domain-containing protein, partial [Limnochordales bacterium]